MFSFGDEKPGAAGNDAAAGNGNGSAATFSSSAAAAAAGLNALVAEERGSLLEKVFAPSDAGSDGTNRCCQVAKSDLILPCDERICVALRFTLGCGMHVYQSLQSHRVCSSEGWSRQF